MCGIAGYWNLNYQMLPDLRTKMTRRGPDSDGVFLDKNIKLFHTRLSIQDLSSCGAQPMTHKSGITITFNGEIYNFKELRSDLIKKGYEFDSSSDTEVLLCLYRDIGMEFLNLLIGMFAIVIYDFRKGQDNAKLFLARDQFGIKPLLYSKIENGLIIGSELKFLLASGLIKPDIDFQSLRELFAVGSVYQPRTLIRNIKSVEAGTYLEFNTFGYLQKVAWAKRESKADYKLVKNSAIDTADFVINQSIEKHLVSDVPITCLLSGGLDSSLLVAMIKKNHDPKINTFTLGFESSSKPSESRHGKAIANYLGSRHHDLSIDFGSIEQDLFEFVSAIDQPSMDGLNTFLVSKEVSKFSKVLISGTGGDEIFGGYPWFATAAGKKELKLFGLASKTVRKNSLFFAKFRYLFENVAFTGQLGSFSAGLKAFGYPGADLLLKFPKNETVDFVQSYLDFESRDISVGVEPLSRLTDYCLRSYTQNQLLRDIDSTSMHFSLEVRVPFISQEVYNFAQALPDIWKLGPKDFQSIDGSYQATGEKFVLQQLAKRYLPESILQRKKQGFELPLDELLKGPLLKIAEEKFSTSNLEKFEFFNRDQFLRLFNEFQNGNVPAIQIWLILVFILWYESIMPDHSYD